MFALLSFTTRICVIDILVLRLLLLLLMLCFVTSPTGLVLKVLTPMVQLLVTI